MSIEFGVPRPPTFSNPTPVMIGILIGLMVVIVSVFIADKLGNAMFRRGFAKPFYIKGHRIHHNCIYLIIPTSYVILSTLWLMGYVQVIWNSTFYFRIATVFFVTAIALAVDFLGDKFWPKIRMNVILHHEWFYSVVPAYVFTYLLNLVI